METKPKDGVAPDYSETDFNKREEELKKQVRIDTNSEVPEKEPEPLPKPEE